MGAAQTDKGAAPGTWGLIAVSILGVVLVIASIWSLFRTLSNSSLRGSVVPTNEAAPMYTVLSQEEIARLHEMAEQRAGPVIQASAVAQPTVIPNKQHDDEVKLQKARAKVNQRIVARMKQYIKDNPDRYNRELEEQIKRRENQGVQSQ